MSVFTPFALPVPPVIPDRRVDIRDHGARPGGALLNTRAIAEAIQACARQGGGHVVVPPGIWLTGAIHFRSRIDLHLEAGAELRFSQNPDDYLPAVLSQRGGVMIYNYSPFLYAHRCEDISITGAGLLNGQGQSWWPWKHSQPGMSSIQGPDNFAALRTPLEERVFGTREAGVRPVFCQPIECKRVLIEGVTFRDSPSWTLQPVWCSDLIIRHSTILNPPSLFSHNTDGIDPDACRNVLIEHCVVDTGDDAICIKAGRDEDAWEAGIPSENILIRHCEIRSGHGGITIGSEMSAGVRNLHAHDCTCDGTDTAIRIKTKPGRGGFIKDILIENITARRIRHAAVELTFHYGDTLEKPPDPKNLKHVPAVENILIRNVRCDSAREALHLRGLPGHPLKNVTLQNLEIHAFQNPLREAMETLREERVILHPLASPDILRHPPEIPATVAATRRVADIIEAPEILFPPEKRPMARRRVIPVAPAETGPARLRWKPAPGAGTVRPMSLRIVAAVDERVPHQVDVANAATGEHYGAIDVLYACPGQVFELALTTEQTAASLRDGLSLSVKNGASPLWIVAPGPNAPDAILPQLYADNAPPTLENFLALFCSAASLQPCDWMEICVLDGLFDWAMKGRKDAQQTVFDHLDTFLHPGTGQRENIRSHPCDDEAGGPESTGPFAILAALAPGHPALRFADEGFEKHLRPGTGTIGLNTIVTESNYNIAYPMMMMATEAGRADLRERALRQLEVARERLTAPDDLYLRHFFDTGEKTFRNWSRGVAWYYLGLVRTLALLPPKERPASLVAEAGRVAAWVTRHQLPDGLWPCFLKENDLLPDSSGSAGIAAALALGVRHGMVDASLLPAAAKALDGLMTFMTHDGWLRGTAQSNKRETHHMDIQRSSFRVIAPWGMGLFAQLAAALDH
ncbi:endopolygalacturonase [Opitutaceae bacterium TAV1]|nr:endopolygalacturonase [Opitutaceae bacterium TAV1]